MKNEAGIIPYTCSLFKLISMIWTALDGSNSSIAADAVIFATGYRANLDFLDAQTQQCLRYDPSDPLRPILGWPAARFFVLHKPVGLLKVRFNAGILLLCLHVQLCLIFFKSSFHCESLVLSIISASCFGIIHMMAKMVAIKYFISDHRNIFSRLQCLLFIFSLL